MYVAVNNSLPVCTDANTRCVADTGETDEQDTTTEQCDANERIKVLLSDALQSLSTQYIY